MSTWTFFPGLNLLSRGTGIQGHKTPRRPQHKQVESQKGRAGRAGGVTQLAVRGAQLHDAEQDAVRSLRASSSQLNVQSGNSLGFLPLFQQRKGQLWTKTAEARKVLPPPHTHTSTGPPPLLPVFEMTP